MDIVYPDYENSIAGVANSILKWWDITPKGPTLPLLDRYLKTDYKNVVVLLLDGAGGSVLEEHLDGRGFLRSQFAGTYSSTFPPTTVAATTSIDSGLLPCRHGWLGWDCYYPRINRCVTVFHNRDTLTGEIVAEESVAWTYCGYEAISDQIRAAGGEAYVVSPFAEPRPRSFDGCCALIKAYCKSPGRKYVYAYWNEPDMTMHKLGRHSVEAQITLAALEKQVEALARELRDTLLVVTADHGMVDTLTAALPDYPVLWRALVRAPTIEPRALNLFVREEAREEFEEAFHDFFGDKFLLLTKTQVLETGLFGRGEEHPDFRAMLGDFLAVATGDLSLFPSREKAARFVGVHAGLTREEMTIPLIVADRR